MYVYHSQYIKVCIIWNATTITIVHVTVTYCMYVQNTFYYESYLRLLLVYFQHNQSTRTSWIEKNYVQGPNQTLNVQIKNACHQDNYSNVTLNITIVTSSLYILLASQSVRLQCI